MIRFVPLVMSLALAIALPTSARAQSGGAQVGPNATAALTPKLLGDALSCRSRDAVEAFAEALFLDQQPPAWMHEAKDDKDTEGMLGLYGYTLAKPTSLLGQRVERVYFMNDWIVTLWPRKMAEAFVTAHAMKRAPIAVTEQYYSFIDHGSGPMLGAFAPTGNAIAAMMAKAFGEKAPPSPPADRLFVGCNYTPASEAEFLEAARRSTAMAEDASRDVVRAIAPPSS